MNSPGCDDFFARLSEYLDGELPAAEVLDFENHLAGCPPCIAFVQNLKQSIALTRKLGAVPNLPQPSSDQVAELRKAYEASVRRRSNPA